MTPQPHSENLNGMGIMLRVLRLLLVGYGRGHHHHPPSHTLVWVSAWKAVLSPKACSVNLKGIATMLVVLCLLDGDVGDQHPHPPSHTLSWLPVWKAILTPKPRIEKSQEPGHHAGGADAASGW